MRLALFNGGESNRLAPHLIQPFEGEKYLNVDNTKGILKPEKDILDLSTSISRFFYRYNDTWVSSNTRRWYQEYQDVLYYAEEGSYPKKYTIANGEQRLGIEGPLTSPTVDARENPVITDTITLTQGVAGDIPDATTLNYLLVRESTDGYTYSYVEERQEETTAPNSNVDFTTGGSEVVKVYRSYQGSYRLVGTVPVNDTVYDISGNSAYEDTEGKLEGTYQYVVTFYNVNDGTESKPSALTPEVTLTKGIVILTDVPVSSDPQVTARRIYRVGGTLTAETLVSSINDNTTTEFVDDFGDLEVNGLLLQSQGYEEAPNDLKFLTEAYAIMFGAVGPKLRYSEIGNPNYWSELNSIDFEDDITGIGAVPNGLLVYTMFKTFIITGTNEDTFVKYLVSDEQGCISHDSINFLQGNLLWASTDGVCTSNGANVLVVTQDKLGKIDLSGVLTSFVYDETYFIKTSTEVLCIDSRFNTIVKKLQFNGDYFGYFDDTPYIHFNGSLHEMFAGTELSYTYKSPKFIGQSETLNKRYSEGRIRSKGNVSVNIYIDEELVRTHNLTNPTIKTSDIEVPANAQNGYSIQYELTGTGEVHEITWKENQNG